MYTAWVVLALIFIVRANYLTADQMQKLSNDYRDADLSSFYKNSKKQIDQLITFAVNPMPNPFIIADNASTIKIGYVVTSVEGYVEDIYQSLAYQGLLTMEYIVNSNGGVNINNNTFYVQLVVLNGGPDCSDFVILYDYLITQVGIDFMVQPVNPGCPYLALLAEQYQVVNMNPLDSELSYLMQSTPPFNNLTYTYSIAANYSTFGIGCIQPMFDKGAKTFASFYDIDTGGQIMPVIEAAALALNMTKVMADSILDDDIQASNIQNGDNCSYFDNIFDQYLKLNPDMLIGTFGIYTDDFVDCMHRYKQKYYNPKAFWLIVGSNFQGSELWEVEGSLLEDFWLPDANFTDPYLGNVSYWGQVYNSIWINDTIHNTGYPATAAVSVSLLLLALTSNKDVLTGLDNIDTLTLVGKTYLVPDTKIYYHPFYCTQRINSTIALSGSAIYPYNTPGVVTAVYPWNFVFPDSFRQLLANLDDKHLSNEDKVLISVLSIIGGIIVIGTVIGFIIWWKWELIFIPKNEIAGNWDN